MENDKINVTITPSQIHDLREDGYSDAEIISAFFQSWNVSNHLKTLVVGHMFALCLHMQIDKNISNQVAAKVMEINIHQCAQEAYIFTVNKLRWLKCNELAIFQEYLAKFITAICSSEIQNAELYKR